MAFPRVGIVIPNWNGKEVTLDCLRSIAQSNDSNHVTIVVDNGSTDGSVDLIRQLYPEVVLIQNPANLGVAEANSQGIVRALELGADYVLLLNNDTIIDPGAIKALVETAESNPLAGALCSKIYFFNSPTTIWSAGAGLNLTTGYYKHLGYNQIDNGRYDIVQEVDCAPSCALLVPRHVFEQIGLWDASYYMYAEDTDFCLRVRAKGLQILLVPSSKIWHRVSFSTGGKLSPLATYYIIRNTLYLLTQYASFRSRTLNALRAGNVIGLYFFGLIRSKINAKQTAELIVNSDSPLVTRALDSVKLFGAMLISPLVIIRHASEFKRLVQTVIRAVRDFRAGVRGPVDLEL